MNKLRKNDEVIVTVGKDKGVTGVINQVLGDKVVIEGVNIVKKHVKANPKTGVTGGIIEKNMPIYISNIAILNPETRKADRIGFRINNDSKERFYKSNNRMIT
jgi:large subunit ribosomal protein L24